MTKFVLILCGLLFSVAAQAEDYKSTFDRVMATNTIRCGYIVYPPQLSKDANSGALSGLAYDLTEQIGKDLGLKIEWTEEVGSGTWQEGFTSGRYDMLCNTAWATTARARVAAFSVPVFYTAINAYTRVGDTRFDGNLAAANRPDVIIATIDGATSAAIAAENFPNAKLASLPDLTDFSHLLMEVESGKADLTFSEAAQFLLFEKNNPGKLHNATPDQPVRLVTNAFYMRGDELRLLNMINATVDNLHNSGYISSLLDRYEPAPGVWRRVALPYQ